MTRIIVGVLALASAPALAQDAAPLVVVTRDADIETNLLIAELEAIGFDAEVGETEVVDLAGLEGLAASRGAAAAVHLHRTGAGIALWIADRITDKTVVRLLAPGDDDDVDRLVAISTVELLRASFLEIEYPPRAEDREIAPPEVSALARQGAPEPVAVAPQDGVDRLDSPRDHEVQPPDEPKMFSLSVGPSLVFGPGGVGPSPHVSIAGRGAFSENLRAGIVASIPVLGGLVTDSGNEADVTVLALGLDVELMWPWPVTPVFGAGATTLLVWMDGSAVPPYVGQRDFVFSAAFFARAGVRWTPLDFLALRADLAVAVAWPTVVVVFADQRVADFGLPYLEPSLSAEVLF